MTALAFICCYNEADILPWTVRHLKEQGCRVCVIDCQSTDGSGVLAREAGAATMPYHTPPVSWRALLEAVEEWVSLSSADWCIHCDADELRYSDIAGESLLEAFERIQKAGFNAVDHQVRTFHPIDNGFDGSQDPAKYFKYFTRDKWNERIGQVKAWRNLGRVELAWSGGHQIRAAWPLRVYHHFRSDHYPIRSQQHGERKVFQERNWLDPGEGRTDWHLQYKGIEPGHSFLKDPATMERA